MSCLPPAQPLPSRSSQTADRAKAADPVRERAEDLAQSRLAALQRGHEGRARGPGRRASSLRRPSGQAGGRDDPWTAALKWLEHSNHEYKSIVRRLSQASGPAAGAADAACRRAGSKARAAAGARCRHVGAEGGRRHLGLADAVERALPGDHAQARRGRGPSQRGAGSRKPRSLRQRAAAAARDASPRRAREAGRGGEARAGGLADPAIQRAAAQVGGAPSRRRRSADWRRRAGRRRPSARPRSRRPRRR